MQFIRRCRASTHAIHLTSPVSASAGATSAPASCTTCTRLHAPVISAHASSAYAADQGASADCRPCQAALQYTPHTPGCQFTAPGCRLKGDSSMHHHAPPRHQQSAQLTSPWNTRNTTKPQESGVHTCVLPSCPGLTHQHCAAARLSPALIFHIMLALAGQSWLQACSS
jgi:hypothetical protein